MPLDKSCLVLFLLFLSLNLSAQNNFQKTFGGEYDDVPNAVTRTYNGNYVLAGYTTSFNNGGDMDMDVYVVKFDRQGDTLWTKTFGGDQSDMGIDIIETIDNGYLVVGVTESFGARNWDNYLLKIGENGELEWSRVIGGAEVEHGFKDVVQSPDDRSFILTGRTQSFASPGNSPNYGETWMIKVSPDGQNIVWNTAGGGDFRDHGTAVARDDNGNYVFTGSAEDPDGVSINLIKTTDSGNVYRHENILWEQNEEDRPCDIVKRSNGNYLISGFTESHSGGGDQDLFLIELDTAGNVLSLNNHYGGSGDDRGASVIVTNDGGYLLTGQTQSYGNGGWDILMIKVDASGTVEWSRTFGGPSNERLENRRFVSSSNSNNNAITKTFDNGYLIVGTTQSFGAGFRDIYLVKTDNAGNSACFQTDPSISANPAGFVKSTYDAEFITPTPQSEAVEGDATSPSIANRIICPVIADFSYADTCVGLTTRFFDYTFPDSLAGYTWEWDFDDPLSPDNSSNSRNPNHAFSRADTYNVQLIASNGLFSDTVSKDVIIARDTQPAEKVYLQSASVERFNDVARLEWEASGSQDAVGYEIYRQPESEAGLEHIGTVDGKNNTQFLDDGLSKDAAGLCYRILTRDYCGNLSEPSNRGCIMAPQVTDESNTFRNLITWEPYRVWNSDQQRYRVYKETDSGDFSHIGSTSGDNRQLIDENLSDSAEEFCYYIQANGGESGEQSRSVKRCITQEPVVHMATGFTPGTSEGVNDKFGPQGAYIKNYTMQIFNRWGEKVYETQNGKDWDGRYEGQLVPPGVYVYLIQVEGYGGENKTVQGSFTIMR